MALTRASFLAFSMGSTNEVHYCRGNKWQHIISRPKRPMESIVLDTGIKEQLVNDTRNFLASKDWYTRRGEYWPFVPYHSTS